MDLVVELTWEYDLAGVMHPVRRSPSKLCATLALSGRLRMDQVLLFTSSREPPTAAWAPACRLPLRALGAGNRARAYELTFHAFLLALALAAIFSTVMLLAAPFLFGWMGGRDKMLIDALSYAIVARRRHLHHRAEPAR